MKKNYQSYRHKKRNVSKSPIYRKAIHIFKLSRQISNYLRGDKSILELNRSSFVADQFSDKLIMASLGLAPKIAIAESTADPAVKMQSVSSLEKTTAALLHYCEKLELNHEHGKEFLELLRKEVKKFGQLQSRWAIHLCNQN
ncbi:hypothetical protein OOZ15_00765 [Galbibacter sp. EGI 63066]|uniref:hypothetical protein n=1 Tax=Galbibacter sp. EGI 63066 TaxID=2993559 RepID=UPI00224896F5|nr:hypothetical protein [Galbibacter sp. EGI 63066]MCX2678460.1 hypothetical protein [Galbibacter sp. EGI 63066]